MYQDPFAYVVVHQSYMPIVEVGTTSSSSCRNNVTFSIYNIIERIYVRRKRLDTSHLFYCKI